MNRFFLSYATIRARQYILDSLNLYRRFLIVFFIAYSIALGNDTPAVNAAIGNLFVNRPWSKYDLVVLVLCQIYALIAVLVTKRSLVGGRVQYFAQSLPLPMSWERAVRAINLTLMNSVILLFTGFGLSTLLSNPPVFLLGILIALNLYLTLLLCQIQFAESRWMSLPVGILLGLGLVMSRGSGYFYPTIFLNLGLFYWVLMRRPLGPGSGQEFALSLLSRVRSSQLRAKFLKRMPGAWILQLSYSLRKPALLLYALLGATAAGGLLYMVMKQNIGLGQKVYVYTVINGFLSLLPAAYFATFNKLREDYQIFLASLPQTKATWLRLDLSFVITLFLLIAAPTGALLVGRGYIPALLPLISLPLLALRYLAFHRSTDTKEKSSTAVTILYGSLIWFGAVGWIAENALKALFRVLE